MSALREFFESTSQSNGTGAKKLPRVVEDELASILSDGMDELRCDGMIITLLSADGKRQIANPPFLLGSRFEFLANEVPASFQNPLATGYSDITSVFGRRSFPNGFNGAKGEFDRRVREKSFFPISAKTLLGDVLAVVCGINFFDEFDDQTPVMPFQRNRITGAWCAIQDRVSEVLSGEQGTIHSAYRDSLSQLPKLKSAASPDVAASLCLEMLRPFGARGITLFKVLGDKIDIVENCYSQNTRAHLSIREALSRQTDFLERDDISIEAFRWRTQQNGANGIHLYMSDDTGIGIHIDALNPDVSLHGRILITTLLERMLWAMNSSLSLNQILL